MFTPGSSVFAQGSSHNDPQERQRKNEKLSVVLKTMTSTGVGMVIDFTDGKSWAEMSPASSPKGHFAIDLVEYPSSSIHMGVNHTNMSPSVLMLMF